MFANFELCNAGLVRAETKQKYRRTVTGCLECRRRKKKCDETLPYCKRCLGQGNEFVSRCEYPKQTLWRKSSQSSSFSNHDNEASLPSLQSGSRMLYNEFSLTTLNMAHGRVRGKGIFHAYDAGELFDETNGIPMSLSSGISQIFNRPEEQQALQCLVISFHTITCPSYVSPRLSILRHGLPLSVEFDAVKKALVACGAALIARKASKKDRNQNAMISYNRAINSLATNLMCSNKESNLATILLLHLFEEIYCDSMEPQRIHLAGAQSIIKSTLSQNPPSTYTESLLLEAYIFHVSLSSIFSGNRSPPLPMNYISNLLKVYRESLSVPSPNLIWMESAQIGVSHEIFNIIFRVSNLRRRTPLKASDMSEAQQLRQALRCWQWQTERIGDHNLHQPPQGMLLMAKIFQIACILLLEKVIDANLQSVDQVARNIMREAMMVLHQIPPDERCRSTYIWPLLILGFAAITHVERDVIISSLIDTSKDWGVGVQAVKFLRHAWTFDEGLEKELGLDVIFRDDLLSEMGV